MVSSQARAALGSFSASRERHARSSDSCTMSSAVARSRASQWAKRSRSGRSDSNSCTSGAPGSGPGSRSPIEETGVSGGELRMPALPKAADYTHGVRGPLAISRRGARSSRPTVVNSGGKIMKFVVQWLIDWPRRVAGHLTWLAPLFARITVGWVFLWSGWGKLHNLPQITQNFIDWGIPFPHLLTPLTSGIELFGGLFLLLGLLTRISAGALGVTMIVAIRADKWGDVDSLETLLGFDEFEYLALFLWLAIAGPGAVSLDHLLTRRFGRAPPAPALSAG